MVCIETKSKSQYVIFINKLQHFIFLNLLKQFKKNREQRNGRNSSRDLGDKVSGIGIT